MLDYESIHITQLFETWVSDRPKIAMPTKLSVSSTNIGVELLI